MNVELHLFMVFGVLGQLGKTGPQCPNFSKIVKSYYLTYGALSFLSRMDLINSFSQAVKYLKSNFENPKIRDSVPTF